MVKKYIDINSSQRDRNKFPVPADFEIHLMNVVNQITDASTPEAIIYPPPISSTNAQYQTYSFMYNPSLDSNLNLSPYLVNIESTWIDTNMIVSENELQQSENAYVNKYIEYIQLSTNGTLLNTREYRQIVNYTYLPNQYIAQFTVGSVINSFEFRIVGSGILPYMSPSYLVGKNIQVVSGTQTGQIRQISWFRQDDLTIFLSLPLDNPLMTAGNVVYLLGNVGQVQLSSPFSRVVPSWPATNYDGSEETWAKYRIRGGIPFATGTVVSSTAYSISISNSLGNLSGYWLWITSNFITYTGAINTISGTTFTVTPSPNFPAGYFNGMYLTLNANVNSGNNFSNSVYRIQSFDGTNFNINPNWSTAPTVAAALTIFKYTPTRYSLISSVSGTTINVAPPFIYQPIAGDTFEILAEIKNNEGYLNYSGSTVSQNQAHCYEIELVSLALPNITLSSGLGGKLMFYPFVYVAFYSVNQANGFAQNVIYSNNNLSNIALFKAPFIYTNFIINQPFVVLTGVGMTQTVSFKPNDVFHFTIYLPDGSIFYTQELEYFQPSPPNPYIQISAMFQIERVEK